MKNNCLTLVRIEGSHGLFERLPMSNYAAIIQRQGYPLILIGFQESRIVFFVVCDGLSHTIHYKATGCFVNLSPYNNPTLYGSCLRYPLSAVPISSVDRWNARSLKFVLRPPRFLNQSENRIFS